jgi:hypothetical protein
MTTLQSWCDRNGFEDLALDLMTLDDKIAALQKFDINSKTAEERVQQIDGAEVDSLYKQSFGRYPKSTEALLKTWQGWVLLEDDFQGTLLECWNRFAESQTAIRWNATDCEEIEG